jgi:hypothetical protein
MANRFVVTEKARKEVAEDFGEGLSISILALVDQSRSCRWYAPVGVDGPIAAEAKPLFDDQVEEAR